MTCAILARTAVRHVKLKSVRNQRSVIMWMVLVGVSLDGRVKIVNKVKLKSARNLNV